MIPPTLQEVETYVKDNGFHFSPIKFIRYYEEAEPPWTYKKGKKRVPVENWKHKARMVWEEIAIKQPHRCSHGSWGSCKKPGVYVSGQDRDGHPYYYCIDHKPQPKPLPKDHIVNTIKFKTIPSPEVNVNNERNRQLDKLERNEDGCKRKNKVT